MPSVGMSGPCPAGSVLLCGLSVAGSTATVGVLALITGLILGRGAVRADPLDLRPVEVEAGRLEPGTAEAEDTSFHSVVDAGQAALEGSSLAERVGQTVGVQVRRTGSHGDLASVLIRGSSAGQVAILLDGIPLSLGRDGHLDLSLFPLLALERVEVFRGYVPAEFGGEGLGGAINLVPSRGAGDPVTRILLGTGSEGFVQLGAARSARHGAWRYALNGGIQGARNEFSFYSDNDTPYETGDDRWLTRQNNQSFVGSFLGWTEWRPSQRLRVSVLESLQWKDKGVPGGGAIQALGTRHRALHQVLDVKVDANRLGHASLSGMLRANLQVARDHFEDPLGEFPGGARDQRDLTLGTGLWGRLSFAPHDPQILCLIPEWRFETYQGRAAGRELPEGRRHRVGLALRDRIVLFGERLRLTPVVRVDLVWNQASGSTSGLEPLSDAFHWFFSPRLGLGLRVAKGVELRGNVGRYFRPPSLFELYGDRGTTMGNPLLVPETGTSFDLGWVFRWQRPFRWLERIKAEAVFFGRDARDLIQWVRNSPHTTTAVNIAEALALGGELSLDAVIRWHRQWRSRITSGYTAMHAENRSQGPLISGKRLPGRPLHEFHTRLDLVWSRGPWAVGLHGSVSHVSDSFLDEANLFLPVPSRTIFDVGLFLRPGIRGVTLAVTVKNVGNLRVEHQEAPAFTGLGRIPRPLMDYAGFPLPGWQIFVTLSLTGRHSRDEAGRKEVAP